MKSLAMVLMMALYGGCTHQPQTYTPPMSIGTNDNNAVVVPIFRLIAAPDAYAGKSVRVLGFLHLEFDGSALYPHSGHAEEFLMLNGLGVSLAPELSGSANHLNDHYVILEGTFRPRGEDAFSGWAGSIEKVHRIEEWSLGKSWRMRQRKSMPNHTTQRNAGSRPSSDDSPASESLSSLGPRG